MYGPLLTYETTLDEMKESGAERLADVPLTDLLEFVRNTCLNISKDLEEDWGDNFAHAAESIQNAIDIINRANAEPCIATFESDSLEKI